MGSLVGGSTPGGGLGVGLVGASSSLPKSIPAAVSSAWGAPTAPGGGGGFGSGTGLTLGSSTSSLHSEHLGAPFSPMVVPPSDHLGSSAVLGADAGPSASVAPAPAPVAVPDIGTVSWFYCDPQGNVQGPFNSREMREWFESGYFVETLPVRGSLCVSVGDRFPSCSTCPLVAAALTSRP